MVSLIAFLEEWQHLHEIQIKNMGNMQKILKDNAAGCLN